MRTTTHDTQTRDTVTHTQMYDICISSVHIPAYIQEVV